MSDHFSQIKKFSYKEQVSRSILWGHYFIFLNILLSCLLGFSYVYASPPTHDIISFAYLIVSWLGHMSFLTVVAYLVIFFPLAFIGHFKIYRVLSVAIAVLLHTILLFDIKIFLIVKVHLGLNAINLIVRELDFDTGLNYNFLFLAIPIVIALETFFAKVTTHSLYKAHHPLFVRSVLSIVGASFICSHLMHIWADATGYERVTVLRSTFPAHYPMTAKSFLSSHGWLSEESISQNLANSSDYIKYPLSKIESEPDSHPYNVLVILYNGLSYSNLGDKTPALFKFKQRSQSFEEHYLLYKDEVDNIFSLTYGLPLQYRRAMVNENVLPVNIEEMFRQDYINRLIVSHKPHQGDTANGIDIEGRYYFNRLLKVSGLRAAQLTSANSDHEVYSRALDYIAALEDLKSHKSKQYRPFSMTLVFNDLVNYEQRGLQLLEQANKKAEQRINDNVADAAIAAAEGKDSNIESKSTDKLVVKENSLVNSDKNINVNDVLDNKGNNLLEDNGDNKIDPTVKAQLLYQVVLKHTDEDFAQFMQKLEQYNVLDNTVVIITSAQGNHLLERTTERYNRNANHVPMMILWPDGNTIGVSVNNLSSHQDISATIASEVLHIKTPDGNFTLGSNLRHLVERQFLISDQVNELYLIGRQDTVIYSKDGTSYIERNGKKSQIRPNLENLIQTSRDLNRFLR